MGLLRLAVLGSPEVFHDGSRLTFSLRKAQALLLYLAVEGGLHPRSKLAAFLWPDSEPHDARTALRNAITLLRTRLADSDSSTSQHSHLLSDHELLGLDPQAPRWMDLDEVQQAWSLAQEFSTVSSEQLRASLVARWQHALSLVRGPFLDGFWLREEAPFDEWVQLQQRQWQVRLQLLFDRLSSWQEAAGELEQARATLLHWLALDQLQEEAYRRLMRVQLALGDPTAAIQVYTTYRARLAEELQVEPSPDIVALAERLRATEARHRGSSPTRPVTATDMPPSELGAPLVGRAAAFSQIVGRFRQVRQGQPQAVLVMGEAGIGKTRLASEFVAWARAQGADVLSGQAFEAGGRLPYQPLVEALRPRLEEENAPEDLLDDLWLAELARLLPELRVRYPDLPAPTQDELTAKVRLFEAVARLFDALAQRAPLVLLLDDLHEVDVASLDLVRYLGRYWIRHGTRVLLLGTVHSEGRDLNLQLSAEFSDLGRDLPVTQVTLKTLSQAETVHLVQAIVGAGENGTTLPSRAVPGVSLSQMPETPLVALGDFLFAHTGGQPFYLLETLKMLREREWLVPRRAADGTWKLEPTLDMAAALVQERSQRELLPPSVRAMILARLAKLRPVARQLVMASTVLDNQTTAKLLWQVAELEVRAGVEALEEVVGSGMLHEEEAGRGRPGSYRFAHDLIREVVYTELGEARRQILHQRAFELLQTEGARASQLAYHALEAGQAEAAFRYSVQAGDEAVAVFAIDDAIGHYEQARSLLQEHQRLQTVLSALEVEHLYAYLGRAYDLQHAWEKAQEAYKELLAYAKQEQQPTLVSRTLNRLAILAVQQSNDKPQVQSLLEEAQRMAETNHDQRALAETRWNQAQIAAAVWEDSKSAFPLGKYALELARDIHDKELEARSLSSLGGIHILAGDFQEAVHYLEASLALYETLSEEPTASQELSIAHFLSGAPPTQPLTHHASEALCWELLALAQLHCGQVDNSIRSGRWALSLAIDSKNVWVQINSTIGLTHGLLDKGAHEEALGLSQQAIALARTLPSAINFQDLLLALGCTYQALQQWEEAQAALEEAVAVAETLNLGPSRVNALSRLCKNYVVTGHWEQAYRSALKASTLRESLDRALIALDFSRHYETEALLRGGHESQARAEVQQLGERLGPYPRFRLSYLRSLAALAAWEGQREQAIGHLRDAAQLATDLGLPGERWQIQASLGKLYKARGKPAQAHAASGEAVRIIHELAESIRDAALRTSFLAAPSILQVMQQAHGNADQIQKDHAEPSGR